MKKIILFLIIMFSSLIFNYSMAKNINLYDQPKADGKVIGSVASEAGIIPIYAPKDNTNWIKIANPKNGEVGWVKTQDIGNSTSNISFRLINSDGNSQGYQTFHFGGVLSPEQTQALAKQMEARQKTLQKEMQQMWQDMNSFHTAWLNFPFVVPVVVVQQPTSNTAKQTTPTPSKKTEMQATPSTSSPKK